MEKDRILDPRHRALRLIALTLLLCSCSLPRIITLNDPLTPKEHINLGVAYEEKGEFDAALKEYGLASDKLALAHLYMGNVYFRKNEYGRARRSYEKAIEKTGDPGAYNNLAWLYYVTGEDLEKALDLARKAVSLSPGSSAFKDTFDKINAKLSQGSPDAGAR